MHRYFIKTPSWIRFFFPRFVWKMKTEDNVVHVTFDDGPHPEITPWVLDQLDDYNAKATFFCVGENVVRYPEVYRMIIARGHAVGNHTYQHLNGWNSNDAVYLDDIAKAREVINSNLFRPPYGKIRSRQVKKMQQRFGHQLQIIMWDVLSADFDTSFSKEQCLQNVLDHVEKGSIIVFHDSEKANENLRYVLPRVLQQLSQEGMESRMISEV
jgi:peptidoglycan-N-acetylglucosamine deacetylase